MDKAGGRVAGAGRLTPLHFFASLALLLALSVLVNLSFHRHGRPLRGVNAIERVIALDSPRPWVTRVLPTLLVKGLVAATPEAVRARITPDSKIALAAARLMRNGDLLHDGMALFGIYYFVTGAVFLFIYSALVGMLSRDLGNLPPVWCVAAAALSLATLPPFFVGAFGYIYDLPQLAFASLLIWLIARKRDLAYLAIFALGCFNKETTALFALLYLHYHWKSPDRARVIAMTACQVALASVIYLSLQRVFTGNGGQAVEHYWVPQFNFLIAPNDWPGVVSIALMVLLLAIGLRGAHRLLRGVLVLALPFAALFLYGGWPGEYRVFLEIWPLLIVIWMLAAYAIYEAATRHLPPGTVRSGSLRLP
jgi:hypothetical protein